jgi:predicted permease
MSADSTSPNSFPEISSHERSHGNFFDGLFQDFAFSLRQFRRNLGFSAIAILTLALGIGANTAIFTLINTVMLARLPVGHPEQLVELHWTSHSKGPFVWNSSSGYGGCDMEDPGSGRSNCSFSYPVFQNLLHNAKSFQSLAAYAGGFGAQLDWNGHATFTGGQVASGEFFSMLEVRPLYGRLLEPSDDRPGAPAVAVLGFLNWQRAFNSDPSIVGKTLSLNGVPFTVVGVAPPEFYGIAPGSRPDLWITLRGADLLKDKPDPERYEARSIWLYLIGRLKPGATPEQARVESEVLFRADIASTASTIHVTPEQKAHAQGSIDANLGIAVTSAMRGLASLRNNYSTQLFVLMGVTGLVLLIACANIANLLLARAAGRRKEIAVRLAIGASRGRLVRQLLTESGMLALLGCLAGFVASYWASRGIVLVVFRRAAGPILAMFHPSLVVFGFAAGISAVTVILFGLVPALTSTRVSPGATLKAAGGSGADAERRNRLGRALVAVETAIALVLVVGAGLFLRTLVRLETLDPGLQPNHILTLDFSPDAARIPEAQAAVLTQELNDHFAALPGVQATSWSSDLMLVGDLWTTGVKITEHPEFEDVEPEALKIGPHFFETLQIPVMAGRSTTLDDCAKDALVIWVNKAFADKYFNGASPLGAHIEWNKKQYEIVGVAGNTKFESSRSDFHPAIFVPMHSGNGYFLVRTARDPAALETAVRKTMSDLAPNLPIIHLQTFREMIDKDLSTENSMARLSAGFGLLALVLAAIGIYGVLAYSVARRTSEIAIRMSLGAMPRNILRLVLAEGLRPALLGSAAGLLASWGLTRFVAQFLYGVKPLDPATLIGGTLALLVIAALACFIPARRAMRVAPMVALRYE